MATNPYVNKVVYNNNTLLDLTADTITAEDLLEGVTAHDASGAQITGTREDFDTPSLSINANGLVYSTANHKYNAATLSSSHDPDFLPENIKKDVTIFGVTGILDPGEGPEPGELRWSKIIYHPGDNGADSRSIKITNLAGKPIMVLAYTDDKNTVHTSTKSLDFALFLNETGRGFTDTVFIDSVHGGNRPGNDTYLYPNLLYATYDNVNHGIELRTGSSSYGFFDRSDYVVWYLHDGTWS